MTTTATTENAAYTAAIRALTEVARAGSTEGVDGRRLAGLRRRGWLADDGRITAAGLDMLPTEARSQATAPARETDAQAVARIEREIGAVECTPIRDAEVPAETAAATSVAKKAKTAKAELNRCACSEDCEATSRNQFAPGHDARWAGITGRAIAVSAPITADEEYLIRMAYDALPTISEKLAAKAARVALTAIAKAKAKRAA